MTSTPKKYDAPLTMALRVARTYLWPHKWAFALAFICMAAISGMTGFQAYLIEPVIEKVFVEKDRQLLFIIAGAVAATSVVKGASAYGNRYIMTYLSQRIAVDMRRDLYRHLVTHDYAFIVSESSGKRVSRFSNDVLALKAAVAGVAFGFLKESLTMVVLVGVMFYQNWQFSLITFAAFPLTVYPILRLSKRIRKIFFSTQEIMAAYIERLTETLHNIVVIKATRQEGREIARADATLARLLAQHKKSARIQALASPMMEILTGCAISAVICYGGLSVMEGTTTSGKFSSFIAAALMAYKPAKSLTGLSSIVQEGLAAAGRLFSVLDVKPAMTAPVSAVPVPPDGEPIVEFRNVGFSYPGCNLPAVSGINLSLRSGETVALVGESGSGKSTLTHLLLRLYDPTEGDMLLRGVNMRYADPDDVRRHIAYVSQQPLLFDASVEENIAYARPGAGAEEIEEAAKNAAADGFIRAMPEGYASRIGENGFMLSGGQRQRLSLARALLQRAPLLVLDEATSALDAASERQVTDALRRHASDRATVVIAHRLSTVRHADRIVVMQKGRVVEEGTHDALLAKNGAYAELYRQGGDDFLARM
ncbi:MAG: ABC transporter ATP-binding protein [Rickettsiales bacterium]